MTDTKHEAPAEGAGEREGLIMALNIVTDPGIITGLRTAEEARSWIERSLQSALRARSSAPEAREGEAVGVVYSLKADLNTAELPDGTLLYTHPAAPSADHAELTRLAEAAGEEALGNLLAVIHSDGGHRALEVGTKQAALEAEKIVARLLSSAPEAREGLSPAFEAWLNERNLLPCGAWDWPSIVAMLNHHEDALRARSSAPEAREGEAVGQVNALYASGFGRMRCTEWAAGDMPEVGTKLYTHPAAPSADKLRTALQSVQRMAVNSSFNINQSGVTLETGELMRVFDDIERTALAALKAEGC